MSEAANQIAQIKANSIAYASVSIRQVLYGFIVTGQIQYSDKDTKGIVMSENSEGVAASADQAAQAALNYLRVGNFEGTQAPDPAQAQLFSNVNTLGGTQGAQTAQAAPAAI